MLCTTFSGGRAQLRNVSWYRSRLSRNQHAALHAVAKNSVNETPVRQLVALPQVLKDQINTPAGTIKGCFDMLLGDPHKTELLADVPFLLTHFRTRRRSRSELQSTTISRKRSFPPALTSNDLLFSSPSLPSHWKIIVPYSETESANICPP